MRSNSKGRVVLFRGRKTGNHYAFHTAYLPLPCFNSVVLSDDAYNAIYSTYSAYFDLVFITAGLGEWDKIFVAFAIMYKLGLIGTRYY